MSIELTRRGFVAGMGAAVAATGVAGLNGAALKPRYGLQLYSIHKIFWKEPARILAALRAGGYDGVEFYDYNGLSAKALKKLCDDAGLKAMGTHLNGDVDLVGDKLKKTLDFAAEAGFESVVTPHAKRNTADEYKKFGQAMGAAAEAADAYGIKVGIHSTYHHFTARYGEETAWDMIYKEASPKLYQQIDTANTFHVGYDVVALLKKYPNRHFSIHAKENVPTKDGVLGVPPTDGGKCVPWKDLIAYMQTEPGLNWWIVEAEGRPDSLDPALACLKQLKAWTGQPPALRTGM